MGIHNIDVNGREFTEFEDRDDNYFLIGNKEVRETKNKIEYFWFGFFCLQGFTDFEWINFIIDDWRSDDKVTLSEDEMEMVVC